MFEMIWKSLGLKKKKHYSDNEDDDNDEQHKKSIEPKRRAQVFAKPQDESTSGLQDIKSMFAANKTRTVHRQEQVFWMEKQNKKKRHPQ